MQNMVIPPKEIPKGHAVVGENEAGANPYPYIYVNADGSARELHQDERQYLETRFSSMDGARPYMKSSYPQKNGWGKIEGFLRRSQLPREIEIHPMPAENPNKPLTKEQQMQLMRDKGFEVVENSDGSFSARRVKLSP